MTHRYRLRVTRFDSRSVTRLVDHAAERHGVRSRLELVRTGLIWREMDLIVDGDERSVASFASNLDDALAEVFPLTGP